MSQHTALSAERWAAFSLDQKVLMIGNEMHRASRLMVPADRAGLERAYERSLRLVDLTVETEPGHGLRRELLRWRDLLAELYLTPSDAARHRELLRALLRLTAVAARQIPLLGLQPEPRARS